MKKRILLPALFLTAAALILSAGCSGGNPYEVARRADSTATVLSESASKSQARLMYEEACADGYAGGFVEFLKEIGFAADDSLAVNSTLLSAVEVYAAFTRSQFAAAAAGSSSYYSIGAGVIYQLDGGDAYVITNYHVVYSASSTGRERIPHISDKIALYLFGSKTDERAIPAEYVGGVMDRDIAVLKVEDSDVLKNSDARAAVRGDSDAVSVGERVYAVGDPNNKGISAVSGILSVDAEYISIQTADEQRSVSMLEMRTDAPVNHGNSGGGLFNAEGKLIGIVNARSEAEGVEHLGYAIPANLACAVAQNIIDNSKADNSHGAMCAVLGATTYVSDTYSEYDEETGRAVVRETVCVQRVGVGAASGFLRTGDVIYSVAFGGTEKLVTRLHILTAALFEMRRDDTVTLTVLRNGTKRSFSFELSDNDDFKLYQ